MGMNRDLLVVFVVLSIISISGCTQQIENIGGVGTDLTERYNLTELILNCESGLVDSNDCYFDVAIKMQNVSYCFDAWILVC